MWEAENSEVIGIPSVMGHNVTYVSYGACVSQRDGRQRIAIVYVTEM